MPSERLQKILAAAGVASRRKAEELISGGHVSLNGNVVTELGTKADLTTDEVRVDGQRITGPEQHLYIMIYKPREFVTTVSDPEGRPTVMDLVRDVRERIFPVGRLDYHSEGLLLLTNDGDLMQKLTATSSHVPKTYLVKVSGQPNEEDLERLRTGIKLPAEPSMTKGRGFKRPGESRRSFAVTTLPAKVQIVRHGDNPWYEITLTEGRNRQIRRMFEEIGHHVEKIKRVRYGPLELNLDIGKWRFLTPAEVSRLRVSLTKPAGAKTARTPEGEERHIKKIAERVIGKTKFVRPPRKDWKARPPKREWTQRPPREGGFRKEGASSGERPPRREGGFASGPKREGGFAKREGGFAARPKREGGFAKREGGFSRVPRPEGSFPKREGGFSRGPKREGGFAKREGGFSSKPKREGGFSKPAGGFSRGPRPEGGFPKREGGFARGPKREGGFSKPAGGFSRGPKREGAGPRGPKREGGFTKPAGGFSRGPKRPGGFGRGPRKDSGPRRGRS
jgi:23S rRNA pseudouridine2605 synthase